MEIEVSTKRGITLGNPALKSGTHKLERMLHFIVRLVAVVVLTLGIAGPKVAWAESMCAPEDNGAIFVQKYPEETNGSVNEFGLVNFLARKDIPAEERALVQETRTKLGFSGKRDGSMMACWKSNPEKQKIMLAGTFRGNIRTYLDEHYAELRQQTHNLVMRGYSSSMRCVPAEEIDTLTGRQVGQLPTFTIVRGMPAEILQHTLSATNGWPPIVQVASRFNGCESPDSRLSELPICVEERTQGTGISLTALVAASMRLEYFRRYGYDAMAECLNGCMVMTAEGEQPIRDAYPTLCVNGYFKPQVIENLQDLAILAQWMRNHRLPIILQWVECEESGAVQLLVFNGAACDKVANVVDWNALDQRTQFLRDICGYALIWQYQALARIAAHTGQDLHLTLVGMGIFRNPPEFIPEALRVVNSELSGTGVRVFLHAYSNVDAALWEDAMRSNGLADAEI
ncbi:MAG: hypothetical protein LBF26_01530 [Puniceicoccales bacterium]|jgi:hypothetical protein|nr:hypothetical protein [Puniceicoccales bacterium]